MADNVTLPAQGTGTSNPVVATDDVGGAQYQRVKLDGGGDGLSVPIVAGQQLAAGSVPVVLTAAQVSTLASSAAQTTAQTSLTAMAAVEGTTADAAVGDATGTINSHLREIAKNSSLSPTVNPGNTPNTVPWLFQIQDAAGNARGANVNASNQLATTTIGTGTAGTAATGVVTVQGIASMTKLLVTPDANSAVNVAQVGGTNSISAGVAGALAVGGTVATNVAITSNPLNIGAQAVSSENSAATTARQVQLVADLVGKLITLPYANPENFVAGTTAAITDTTSTSVIASAGGSLRNYITSILVSNSHATVGTFVKILDGASIIYEGYAAPAGGGFAASLPVPLRGTAATAVNAQAVTTGANFIVSCAGYKGL